MLAYGLGVILVLVAGWLLAVAAGWALPYDLLTQGIDWLKGNPWQSLALAILILFLGLLLFFRPRTKVESSFRTPSKWGEVRIAKEAVQEIIARSALALTGVRQVESSLCQREEGLEITVVGQFAPEQIIPVVTEELQALVQQDVERYTGLRVAEVKVLVRSFEPARVARVR